MIGYILKTTNFLAHGANEYYKTKIWDIRIIEKTQKIEIWDLFYEYEKIYVWLSPRYGKNQNIEKYQSINFDECLIFLNRPLSTYGI